ncbi:MAG: tetratricopeptide repeat protein [Candidatus Omnitrophica bacterium]|nr:tetratricopeptide repeat protein [Candidatus Omnitrophota bacterium]
MKKVTSLLFFVFLLAGSSFAGELISKEAVKYYNEAVKLQKAHNFDAADILYGKTLLVDPYNTKWQVLVLNNRGVMLAQQGFKKEAEPFFEKAIEIDENYAPAKLNLALIYDERRSELDSIKYWLKALNIDLNKLKPRGFVIGNLQE